MRFNSLATKVSLYMTGVSLAGGLLTSVGAYFIYALIAAQKPEWLADQTGGAWYPIDSIILCALILLGLSLSAVVSVMFTRRLLQPLTSLATTARQIQEGDLGARARAEPGSAAEAEALVADFNAMAARVEAVSNDITLWNASIAHELRTPVTILIGQLSAASDGLLKLDGPLLASLRDQAASLGRLIEDLRVVSLASAQKLMLHTEPLDLAAAVTALRPAVTPLLAEAGFMVDWRLSPAHTLGDAARLRQAILALIDNAIKHAEAQAGPLIITTGISQGVARISVSDAGPGLAADIAPRLFDPYFRMSKGRDGSGLGLMVVRAIAEAHGGVAVCDRNERSGLDFSLDLPGLHDPLAPPLSGAPLIAPVSPPLLNHLSTRSQGPKRTV